MLYDLSFTLVWQFSTLKFFTCFYFCFLELSIVLETLKSLLVTLYSTCMHPLWDIIHDFNVNLLSLHARIIWLEDVPLHLLDKVLRRVNWQCERTSTMVLIATPRGRTYVHRSYRGETVANHPRRPQRRVNLMVSNPTGLCKWHSLVGAGFSSNTSAPVRFTKLPHRETPPRVFT